MATPISWNNVSYSVPAVGESRTWGTSLSAYLIAISTGALSKAGGTFTLTADANFGPTYGLVAAYIKGAVGNISSTGIIRLANLDTISWRNAANAADLALRVNASDRLQFGGVDIPTISSTDTLTNKTMSGASNTFTNMPVGTTGVSAIANGGTAVSALPTTQSASAFAAWDANQNLSANNFINDYATTATVAGTTTLTVSSKRVQFFTGSTTQNCDLPVASTLTVGHSYYIRNLSTGVVTVRSSGANTVIAMQPQDGIIVTCILASGTDAASWSVFSELANTSATGALSLPAGTAAQRPTAIAGQVRLNTDTNSFEGYANGAWSSIGGGLNELPQKNYLKTYSDAVVAPGTLSTLASTTANLVSLTAFYADSTSGSSALTSDTSSTLRGTTNYLTAAGAASSTGARFIQFPAFALEGTDLGKPISISFDVSGVTADGNWDAVIVRYNSSGVHQSIISIAGNASSGTTPVSAKLPTGTTTFNGFFVPDSTTAGDLYALRLRHLVSNAAIRVDTLFVGNQPIRVGGAGQDGQAYTPTLTNGTNITPTGSWGRSLDAMLGNVTLSVTGAGSGGTLAISIPSTFAINTTLTPVNSTVGTFRFFDSGTNHRVGSVTVASTTTLNIYLDSGSGAMQGSDFAINDTVNLNFRVIITGWSSNVTMADRAVEYYLFNTGATTTAGASNSAATTAYGPLGTAIIGIASATGSNQSTSFVMTPQQTLQATDKVFVELSNGGAWVSAENLGLGAVVQSTSSYGISVTSASTSITVGFGNKGAYSSGLYAADGAAWSGLTAYKWRVRVVSAGAQVGYPISSANIIYQETFNVITGTATVSPTPTNVINLCNSASAFTITIGAIASAPNGTVLRFKNIGAGNVTLDPNASETIDGQTTWSLSQYSAVELIAYNGAWYVQ